MLIALNRKSKIDTNLDTLEATVCGRASAGSTSSWLPDRAMPFAACFLIQSLIVAGDIESAGFWSIILKFCCNRIRIDCELLERTESLSQSKSSSSCEAAINSGARFLVNNGTTHFHFGESKSRERRADLRDMRSSFQFCPTKEANWRVNSENRTKIDSCDTAAAEGAAGVELDNASSSSSKSDWKIQVHHRIHYLIYHHLGNRDHWHFRTIVVVVLTRATRLLASMKFHHHRIRDFSRLDPHRSPRATRMKHYCHPRAASARRPGLSVSSCVCVCNRRPAFRRTVCGL